MFKMICNVKISILLNHVNFSKAFSLPRIVKFLFDDFPFRMFTKCDYTE